MTPDKRPAGAINVLPKCCPSCRAVLCEAGISRWLSKSDLWTFYAIAFPNKHAVEDFAANRFFVLSDDFESSSIETAESTPRQRLARGEQIPEWLFEKIIDESRYKPKMQHALRAVLVEGSRIQDAAQKSDVTPETLKKAAAKIRHLAQPQLSQRDREKLPRDERFQPHQFCRNLGGSTNSDPIRYEKEASDGNAGWMPQSAICLDRME